MSEYTTLLEQKSDEFVSELKKYVDDADLINKLAHDNKLKNKTLSKYKEFFQTELDSEVKKCKNNSKKLKLALTNSKKERDDSVKKAKVIFDAAEKVFTACKNKYKTVVDTNKKEFEKAEESTRLLRNKKTEGTTILHEFIHQIQLCVKEKNNLDNKILCSSNEEAEGTEVTEVTEEAEETERTKKAEETEETEEAEGTEETEVTEEAEDTEETQDNKKRYGETRDVFERVKESQDKMLKQLTSSSQKKLSVKV